MMKKSKISIALIAAIYTQVPVYAAEAETAVEVKQTSKERSEANKQQLKESDIEVITVGGMRASEVSAINMKKFADTISDNLSAEEVGALPDNSIAESLERLTGVTGNQENGRSNTVSVRGMGGAYTLTTLNNREIVSSFGSRSINLSLFPSSSIRRAQVYKTARADALEGGIAGHINMETFKPLEVDRNVKTFSASVNGNELSQDLNGDDTYGKNLDGMFSYHINDDFAFSLGGSWRDDVVYIEGIKAGEVVGNLPWFPDRNGDGIVDIMNTGSVLTSKKQTIDQKSFFAAAQWQAHEDLLISVDYLNSTYDFDQNGLTLSMATYYGAEELHAPGMADVNPKNNYFESGMFRREGTFGKWDNDVINEDETQVYGLNFDYTISDDLSLNVDISHSSADRFHSWRSGSGQYGADGMNHYFSFDHHGDEYGFEYHGSDTDGSAFNFDDYTLDESKLSPVLNDPEVWNFEKLSNGHNYMESDVSALKFDLTYDLDLGIIHQLKFGARYSRNTKDHIDDKEEYSSANTREATNGITDEEWTATWAQISDLNWDELNSNQSSNPYQKLTKVKGFDDVFYYDVGDIISDKSQFFPERYLSDDDKFAGYELEEDTTAVYVQAAFAGDWYDGIVGVRYFKTDLESTSWQDEFVLEQIGDDEFKLTTSGNAGFVTSKNDYNEVLPTLNVNLRLIDDLVIRIGAGKSIVRPSLGDINSSLKLKSDSEQEFDDAINNQSKTLGTAGNPYLNPIVSSQADISFEYYPNRKDYYAVAGFYKDIDGIYQTDAHYIPTGSVDERGYPIELPVISKVKSKGGSVSGIEFSFRQDFGQFATLLHGFSISGNYMEFFHDAYQDYNRENPGKGPIDKRATELYYSPEGWLDSTYNLALTYDPGQKFSARLNLNQQEGRAAKEGNNGEAVLHWPSKNLSFNMRYKMTKQITAFASASNLLDEATTKGNLSSTTLGDAHTDRIYEQYHRGISYYAGVRVNF